MKKCKVLLTFPLLILLASFLFACQETPVSPTLTHISATSATCEAEGNAEYWLDEASGKYYRDSEGKVETTPDAMKIPALSHAYGEWTVDITPNLSENGRLTRVCANDSTHEESCDIPEIAVENGYRLVYKWDELKGKEPTFQEDGVGYYVYELDGQYFPFEEPIENLGTYYASLDSAKIYTVDDYTYTGATYNEEAHTLLIDGSASTVSFTAVAEKEGFYTLHLQYCTEGNKTTKLTVKNETYTEWKAEVYALLSESSKNKTKTYLIPDYEVDKDFPNTPAITVYLKKGVNRLTMTFSAKVGINRALLTEKLVLDEKIPSVILPYTGVVDRDNGDLIYEGNSGVGFSFDIPEDGTYKICAFLSTTGCEAYLESTTNSFPTLFTDIPAVQSGSTTAERRASALYYEIGTLSLTKGTHTARFVLKETDNSVGDFLHTNLLALVRVDDLMSTETVTADLEKKADESTHSVALTLRTSGTYNGSPAMRVVIDGYYTHENGNETAFTQAFEKTAYNQTFTYTTTPLTGDMDGVTYMVSIYDATGKTLLRRENRKHYSIDDTLTVFMMADLHYTGSNLTQDIRNYAYDESNPLSWSTGETLKSYNSYRTSYEAYGWSSDQKIQRVMDDIIQRYKAGEFDIVLFLGDQTMGDGNYPHFHPDHVQYPTYPHFGQSMLDYWNHPLNTNYMLERSFLDQLAEEGIPYFCSYGNHETLMDYGAGKAELLYDAWESEYHYMELFGHKNEAGEIYDATPNNFFVRVIRRDGETKLLSALSTEELEAFKARQAGDGNCYDYFVSEDSLTADDIELGSLLLTNTYQYDSYSTYMEKYVFGRDPYTGEIDRNQRDYNGQTIRTDYHSKNILEAMDPMLKNAENIYVFSHNFTNVNGVWSEFFAKYPQIQAMFMGDVHDETFEDFLGLVPKWVAGCFSCAYDVDFQYTYDVDGNRTGNDSQYYYYKNNRVGHSIGGDYRYHSFSYMMLHIKGSEAYAERERIGFFYKNTEPQYKLYGDRVIGWDPDYTRAVDYTHEAGESFTVGNRTVFVGGDCFLAGDTHFNIAKSYTRGAYNLAEYVLYPTETSSVYTVCDLAGRSVTGGDTTVTLTATKEGTTLTLNGETYYIVSTVGGVVGHYLYDENGDFVYVDKNGDYVFYDFYTDENGEYVKEYFYEKDDGSFVALGEWNADHTKYTLKDGIYTDMWLNGDPMTVSRLDSVTDDEELFSKITYQLANGKFKVDSGTIEIKSGAVIRGRGFMNFGYAHRFVDAEGNEVSPSDIKQNFTHTYTYTLNSGIDPDGKLSLSDFTVTDNGMQTTYGFYVPRMKYQKQWIYR